MFSSLQEHLKLQAARPQPELVEQSESRHGDMDVVNSLLRAARAGNLRRVVEFIEDDLVDINSANQNGLTALHSASKEGRTRVVEELLARGANVHAKTLKGNTALHIASLAGHEPVVKMLIDKGADVDGQSASGFTALYMAAQENHEAIVKLLLASGANQNIATTDGFTVSSLTIYTRPSGPLLELAQVDIGSLIHDLSN